LIDKLPSSFRDPSGFLFKADGVLYRQVNDCYRQDYDCLIESGLQNYLTDEQLVVSFEEIDSGEQTTSDTYKILRPDLIKFVSYPWEWCYSQLKDAALLTLKILRASLEKGMVLKDASAFNIQFFNGKPILIDTLSFERYQEGSPWVAYKQFCQHFLAPLALRSFSDERLGLLSRIYIDGIPLDLCSKFLPMKTSFMPGIQMHIHLHAKSQIKYADKEVVKSNAGRQFSLNSFMGMIDNLEATVNRLEWNPGKTEWGDYYNATNYSEEAQSNKKQLVEQFTEHADVESVWDLGANSGFYSRIASDKGINTVAFDIDPVAVEANYRETKKRNEYDILPLIIDLTNPSPAVGWHNRERDSLIDRGPVDLAMALALIHHLAISNNLPFKNIAEFFSETCDWLIIEFVPKNDSQVKRLLTTREDIFKDYDQGSFEQAFSQQFTIEECEPVQNSHRTLYLMKRK